ncbi:hypothetical protein SH139x_000332 [Planctomycetaceae bacterium SH139]
MAARQIVCPKCNTKLQIPATLTAGKVKCPKCATVLAIRPPAAPNAPIAAPIAKPIGAPIAAPIAAPIGKPIATPSGTAGSGAGGQRGAPSPSLDPFDDLPSVGPVSQQFSGPQGFPTGQFGPPAGQGFPAQSFPAGGYARGPAARKPSAGGKSALKIMGIIGGIGLLGVLLCGGGIVGLGVLGSMSSGWKTETFRGFAISMPAGKDRQTKSEQTPNAVVHELIARRKETGSQYSLVVVDIPNARGANISVDQLVGNMQIRLSNRVAVTRSGVPGISGKMAAGAVAINGAEVELFLHQGTLVVATYAPYSVIKDRIGGTRKPRTNERNLDDPEVFFSSLKFP